jgi:hypothetical protein
MGGMRNTHSQRFFRTLLEPKAIVLLIALLHFLWVAVYVARELQTEGGRSADVDLYLFEPFFLLLAAFILWRGKLWGFVGALLIAGLMVYQMGYLGYLRTAKFVDAPPYSRRALNAFYWGLFGEWEVYGDKPRHTFQLLLASVITSFAVVLLSREMYRRLRGVNHGI